MTPADNSDSTECDFYPRTTAAISIQDQLKHHVCVHKVRLKSFTHTPLSSKGVTEASCPFFGQTFADKHATAGQQSPPNHG